MNPRSILLAALLLAASCADDESIDDDANTSTASGNTAGCPAAQPEDGTDCTSPGKQCSYGGTECTCQEYRWFCGT